jgi:RHS repeat-associated protein
MPYQYNGKELNEDFGLGLSDYGARWYDASLGRWWSVDPMAEQYHQWSGYCYVMDNPLSFVDLDGMSASSGQHNHLPKGEDPLEVKCPECLKQGEMIPGTDQTASTDEVPIDGGKGGVPESTKPAEEFQGARAVDLLSQEIGRIQRDAYMQTRPMASGALGTLDLLNDPVFFAVSFIPSGVMRGASSARGASRLIGFGDDAAILENSANLIPKKGWYDVVIHGTEDGLGFTINKSYVTPEQLFR